MRALPIAALLLSTAPAHAYLRLHPDNPRYLQETRTGEAVLIAGYGSIVPSAATEDHLQAVRELSARRVGYARVWHLLPWLRTDAIWPWGNDTSEVSASLGRNKFDLSTWNGTYWQRLKQSLQLAADQQLYAEPHLFDRCGISPASDTRWANSPWAQDNNVNDLETPPSGDDGTPEFYQLDSRPNLRAAQERWVRKFIDETIEFENVIYEIENEHWELDTPDFAAHYAQLIRAHLQTQHAGAPRLISYSSLEGDLESFFDEPEVDIVNKHYGGEPEDNPDILRAYLVDRWVYAKAINIDEFANGVTSPAALRKMCWLIVTAGGHFHIEDAAPEARPYDAVENVRSFVAHSGWDFVHAAPASEGNCMAKEGAEYVCYVDNGGSQSLTLPAGDYRAAWWNPREGGFVGAQSITGGARTLSAPSTGDWVLHVTADERPTLTLRAPSQAITVDADASDWAAAASSVRGGSTGIGDQALMGIHDGVNYAGGHAVGTEFPPEDTSDHSVSIRVAHDDASVFFLVEVRDSDVQTTHSTDENWANDCIELYVHPSGGQEENALSESTSAVQIVVDAANQRNVYMTTPAYGAQVKAGVRSAVRTTAGGYVLEIAVARSALFPGASTVWGVDFIVRDDDGAASNTSIYSWADPTVSTSFPTKIPARWGRLELLSAPPAQPDAGSPARPDAGATTPPRDAGARHDAHHAEPRPDASTTTAADSGTAATPVADGGAAATSSSAQNCACSNLQQPGPAGALLLALAAARWGRRNRNSIV